MDFARHLFQGLNQNPSALWPQPYLLVPQLQEKVQHRVPFRGVGKQDARAHKALEAKELAKVVVSLLLAREIAHGLRLVHQQS